MWSQRRGICKSSQISCSLNTVSERLSHTICANWSVTKNLFTEAFHNLLAPVLAQHGFRRILPPRGWMAPAELFESHDRWFGTSWDWRDASLEASLGRLFQYRDVMPRVVIQGPYSRDVVCREQEVAQFLDTQLSHIAASLPSALASFDARLDESLRAVRNPPVGATAKGRRILAEHLARVGEPLSLAEWTGCRIIE